MEGFPAHDVYGENAPKRSIVMLLAGGLFLAATALWLSQEVLLRGSTASVPDSPVQGNRGPAPAAENLKTGTVREGTAPVAAPTASSPKVASDMQAECPASVVFHFPTGAVTPLELNAKATFDPIIGWARQHESAIVAVEGHADTVGEDESNLLLSYQRARAVAAMLERHGVAALQVQIAATGSHGLIAGIPGDAFGNRRVTIQIKNPGVCRISSH